MAWELTWPFALIDLAVVLLLHGVLDVTTETGDAAWGALSFFVVSPWVIRRALRREYAGSTVVVLRGEASSTALSYQESLKVMWLLAWRWLVLSLVALLLVSLVLRVLGLNSHSFSTPDPLTSNLGMSIAGDVSNLFFFPLLIPGMISKRYRGFHLEVRAPELKQPAPKPRPARKH